MLPEKKHTLGVFGGTFDPVHEGHLRLASFILKQKLVERILFLPAARPPHKPVASASFSHRVAMINTAISSQAEMAVSSLEARLVGPSYTVDTLKALQVEEPSSSLYFILGADSLLELHLWHRFEELFGLAVLLIVARSGLDDALCYRALQKLPGGFLPDATHRVWRRNDGATICYLSGFSSPVSSSWIRQQVSSHSSPLQGVAPEVQAYIHHHGLYQTGEALALHR